MALSRRFADRLSDRARWLDRLASTAEEVLASDETSEGVEDLKSRCVRRDCVLTLPSSLLCYLPCYRPVGGACRDWAASGPAGLAYFSAPACRLHHLQIVLQVFLAPIDTVT